MRVPLAPTVISLLAGISLGACWKAVTLPRTVDCIIEHPEGKFYGVVTYRSYLAYVPMPPGSSGDKPGFLQIIGKHGEDYGEMPLGALNQTDFQWTEKGAKTLYGEWDFEAGTCYYWDQAGDRKIYSKSRR